MFRRARGRIYDGPPDAAALEELTMTGAGLFAFRKPRRKLRPAPNALTAITRALNPAKHTLAKANADTTPNRPSEPGLTRLLSSSTSRRKDPPARAQKTVMSVPNKATS